MLSISDFLATHFIFAFCIYLQNLVVIQYRDQDNYRHVIFDFEVLLKTFL